MTGEELRFNGSCDARSGHYPAKNSDRTRSDRSCEAVKEKLEELVPPLDPAILGALREGDIRRAKEARQRGPELAIFSARDHGGLLRIADLARKAAQYQIGNPLTATRMVQHQLQPRSMQRNNGQRRRVLGGNPRPGTAQLT